GEDDGVAGDRGVVRGGGDDRNRAAGHVDGLAARKRRRRRGVAGTGGVVGLDGVVADLERARAAGGGGAARERHRTAEAGAVDQELDRAVGRPTAVAGGSDRGGEVDGLAGDRR